MLLGNEMISEGFLLRPILESYWVIPGSLLAGEYPGVPFSPEVTNRRLDAFLKAGFNTFINLTMLNEVDGYADLIHERPIHNIADVECLRFPIGDFGLPGHGLMAEILGAIDQALARERKIYVHCNGGIGRTGTIVGCILVHRGYSGRQALDQLSSWWLSVPKSAHHPNSPETFQQKQFVLNWADHS